MQQEQYSAVLEAPGGPGTVNSPLPSTPKTSRTGRLTKVGSPHKGWADCKGNMASSPVNQDIMSPWTSHMRICLDLTSVHTYDRPSGYSWRFGFGIVRCPPQHPVSTVESLRKYHRPSDKRSQ